LYYINEYIKSTNNQFIELYEKLFKWIFQSGVIPEMWVSGTIKQFYKNKGEWIKVFENNLLNLKKECSAD
jgi:hypothetical protein